MNIKERYLFCRHHKAVVKNRLLFASFHGREISDSPLAVLQELVRRGDAARYDIWFETRGQSGIGDVLRDLDCPVHLVDIATPQYAEVLATARYLVHNSSFPEWFMKRPEQTYVQTWHGTPLKTLGKRMHDGLESMYLAQHTFLEADWLALPNEYTKEVLVRDYNLAHLFTGRIAVLGSPRNDCFTQLDVDAFKHATGLTGENFAYMPTWRGASTKAVDVDACKRDIERTLKLLNEVLHEGQTVYVSLHSMVADRIVISELEHVKLMPSKDKYEFLAAMDALITDYSSVMFDYSITGKPIILFAYDEEAYLKERGMYLSLEELPFLCVRDFDELGALFREGRWKDAQPYRENETYRQRFIACENGQAATSTLALLFGENLDPAIPIESYEHNSERKISVIDSKRQNGPDDVITLCEEALLRKNAVVLLNRNKFTLSMNQVFRERYLDRVDAVFVTRMRSSTLFERALGRLSKRFRATLDARDMERMLPRIVSKRRVRDVLPKPGTVSFDVPNERRLKIPVVLEISGQEICASFDTTHVDATSVALTFAGKVLWMRELSEAERADGTFSVNPMTLLYHIDPKYGRCYKVALVGSYNGKRRFMLPSVSAAAPSVLATFDPPEGVNRQNSTYIARTLADKKQPLLAVLGLIPEEGLSPLSVIYTSTLDHLRPVYPSTLIALRRRGDRFVARVRAPQIEGYRFCGFQLCERTRGLYGKANLNHTKTGEDSYDVEIPLAEMTHDGYWDFVVLLEGARGMAYAFFGMSQGQQNRLYLADPGLVDTHAGRTCFPYTSIDGMLAFTARTLSPYDGRRQSLVNVVAYIVWHYGRSLFCRHLQERDIWILFEKYSSRAQDNAYALYRWCQETLPAEERKDIYFVIDPASPDAHKLGTDDHVLKFMSFKYLLYLQAAKALVSSEAKGHALVWMGKPNPIQRGIAKKYPYFLQHGVTALKRVDHFFGANGSARMARFVVTSKREQEIVTTYFGYSQDEAPILGFTRWDYLEDHSSSGSRRSLLVMPTWRPWLETLSDKDFAKSEYCTRYSSLIHSEQMQHLCETYACDVVFFIHPKLARSISAFGGNTSEYVHVIEQGERQLNELIMESSLMITDYSSVAWDELYMRKPVVFYQFDADEYRDRVGSYIGFDELPGPSCRTEDEVLAHVERIARDQWRLADDYLPVVEEWLPAHDRLTCERTYRYLRQELKGGAGWCAETRASFEARRREHDSIGYDGKGIRKSEEEAHERLDYSREES